MKRQGYSSASGAKPRQGPHHGSYTNSLTPSSPPALCRGKGSSSGLPFSSGPWEAQEDEASVLTLHEVLRSISNFFPQRATRETPLKMLLV